MKGMQRKRIRKKGTRRGGNNPGEQEGGKHGELFFDLGCIKRFGEV